MSDIKIRKIKIDDAKQFIEFEKYIYCLTYKKILSKDILAKSKHKIEEKIKTFKSKYIDDENVFCYILEKDNKIIGYMLGVYLSHYEYYNSKNFADLEAIYIHPNYQHLGLGKKLFDLFVKTIKQKNIDKFVIGVLKDNLKARKAYEKWGGILDEYTSLYKEKEEIFYIFTLSDL